MQVLPLMPVHLPLAQSASMLQLSPSLSLHAPAPLHTLLPSHCGASSVPSSGMFVHVPAEPLMLQDLQSPSHTSLQHTVSTHASLLHSFFAAQVVPSHFLHEPPQSTPVSLPFIMPSVHETHLSMKQDSPALGQLASDTHSTHIAMLLQNPPGHGSPMGSSTVMGVPLVHFAVVHGLLSPGGVSLLSVTVIVPPMPSQTSSLQSPFVGSFAGVPAGRNV